MKTRPLIRSRIWAVPSIIAAPTLLGLLSALIVAGVRDGLAGAVLAVTPVCMT